MNSTQLLQHQDTMSLMDYEEQHEIDQVLLHEELYQQLEEDYLDYLQDNHIHPDIGLTPKSFNEWINTTTVCDLPF